MLNSVVWAEKCIQFVNSTEVSDEFVKVQCFYKNISIYIDYHSFIPTKKVSKLSETQDKAEKLLEEASVLVLGVDSVSRLNFIRNMPETSRYLKTLEAIELVGYNKVADNTFPNLIPVLTGLTVDELKSTCWPRTKCVFDGCEFVWDNFSSKGHVTGFAEECSHLGLFNFNKLGFHTQPTDYYMRIFERQANNDIGFKKSNFCLGPRKHLVNLLNNAEKFTLTFKDYLSFGFFWSMSLSHDGLNHPQEADKEFKPFLETLVKHGVLENTILVFMSDHGIRFGPIRKTYQGYLEERLPFLFLVLPKWFKNTYGTAVSNLMKNSKRLTTPFDLHETLNDLVDLKKLQNNVLRKNIDRISNAKTLPRGISLFLPIPKERTCKTAGILEHWCTCHQFEVISTSNELVERATNYVVGVLNSLLVEYPQCVELKLYKIEGARSSRSTSLNSSNMSLVDSDLSVTFSTKPGNGMFEANVRHNAHTEQFKVIGTVSRINEYGEQSRCVDLPELRLYCFCKKS